MIIIVGEAKTACGIKRLFGSIGRPPTNQSAHFNDFSSEAKHRLGYFFAHFLGQFKGFFRFFIVYLIKPVMRSRAAIPRFFH